MEVVSAIITPVVESLLGPIKRHLGFLFSSTKYVRDMRDRKMELNYTATDMKKRKEEYDVKNLRVPELVPSWLKRAEEIDREINSISAGGNGCLHMKRRYKVGKKCSNVIKRIEGLMKENSNMKWTNEQKPLGRVDSATPQVLQDVTENIFTSRQLIFQRALQLLEADDTTQMVALCGMGGIGKTTMMKELKKVVENRKLFDWVVKAVIGNSTDPIALQDAIADYVRENLSEKTKEARADRLKKIFLGMSQDGKKKILIILDDLWKMVDLEDIGLACPLPKGFKLFLTSRDEKPCHQMGVETSSIVRMVGLEEAEAKQLFWELTGLSAGTVDHQLNKLGEDIVKRCGGLPIAIKTIALALKGEIKDAWRVTLSHLRRHDLQHLQDLYVVAHDIFEISYNYLKNDDDKEIFILSGLFPDDFDIPLEDLMRYGWGLKLFKKVYSLAEARQRTNTSVHNLIRANLLVKSDETGCVKMHDLARSFVLSNISKFKQASIVNPDNRDTSEWPTQDTRESCERIFLKCKGLSELPRQFDYPHLKLLKLLMNDYEKDPLKFPDDFYTRMKQLQVISYRGIENPSLVPISLQCSTSLRVLCLRSCSLMDDLSSIGQLSNLEILSFADCRIKNLPSAVGKLRRLKLLDLTGCGELCIGDGVFQNLDDLEELYMSDVGFTEDNCEGLEMVSKKLTALEVEFFENNIRPNNVSFKNLERFWISIGCEVDAIYVYHSGVDDEPYENQNELFETFEKTLRLVASCEEVRASEINELFEKTEKLHLQVEDMNHLEDVLMHPSDQYSFCNLKYLSFKKCANLKYLFTVNVASTLTNLEKLIVECCDVLGSLIHDENNGAEVITFHKLRLLKLKELPEFVGLCDNVNIVMELPQLLMLSLSDIPNITCIFDSSNNISATTIPLLNKKVVCPKLKILNISSMKNLKEIWACEEEYYRTPVLKEINVYECDEIQNLFPNNPMLLLSHLETLTVDHCGSIQALFDIDSECVGQVNSSLRSIRASGLGKLREVWRIRGEYNSGLYVRDFQALESIDIRICKNFRDIVTPTTIKFDMGSLTDIITFWSGWSGGSDEENEISEVDDSRVLFSSVHTLHHVSSIRFINGLKHVEVIFDIQIPSVGSVKPNDDEHGEQTTTTSKAVKLPNLRDMNLEDLASLKYIWKSNVRTVLEFPSLTKLSIDSCNKLEHVFTCSMVGSLLQLKELSVSSCSDMEVIVKEDQEEEGGDGKVNEIRLPCLKSLKLKGLDSLKGFCLGNVDYSLPSLEHMKIKGCKSLTIFTKGRLFVPELKVIKTRFGDINLEEEEDINSFIIAKRQEFSVPRSLGQYSRRILIKRDHALSTVFPSCAADLLQNIEVLEVYDCSSMVEVFETKELENSPPTAIPRLKSITTHKLLNLKSLYIEKCHRLVDIFTFSTLGSLRLLEKLSIRDCEELKLIVREEHGEQTTTTSKAIIFPCLESIILADLPNLKGFFFGMNEFQLPLLDELSINRCPQMMVLTSLPLRAPKLKYININGGKYCTPECCSFFTKTTLPQTPSQSSDNTSSSTTISEEFLSYSHSLIEMNPENERERQVIFSYDELLQLQNLEKLAAEDCESVVEVFDVGTGVGCSNSSQTVVQLPKLRDVFLWDLNSLKYIWKSNGRTILEFPNLTKLIIDDCNQLEHVFTSSMVGSLLQLKELYISSCQDMEVIVKEDQEEEGGDGKVNEIRLPCLEFLNLEGLESLKGFCLGNVDYSLPSLDSMKILNCKSLTIFTKGRLFVPKLKVIETSLGDINLAEEQDVNSLIITKRQEGFHFGNQD